MVRHGIAALAVAALLLGFGQPAHGQLSTPPLDPCLNCDLIYSGDGSGRLHAIDAAAGTSVFIGNMPAVMLDIGISADGRLFGLTGAGLYEISACNASAAFVGSTTGFKNGLGGELSGPLLFSQGPPLSSHDSSAGFLQVDVGGTIGAMPPAWCGGSAGDLAFNPVDGRLYSTLGCGGCGSANHLVELDPSNGDVLQVVGCLYSTSGAEISAVFGMAFDSCGDFFVGTAGDTRLFRIDPVTGIGEPITISGGYLGTFGLASRPCDPARVGCPPSPGAECMIDCPDPIEVDSDQGVCGAAVRYTLMASGGCDLGSVQCDSPPGTLFPVGTTLVQCSALSGTGVPAFCEFTVTVIDRDAPRIDCPQDSSVECGRPTDPASTGAAAADDACGVRDLFFDDLLVGDCGGTGTITRTWTAIDESQNEAMCAQSIVIVDTTPPEVFCNARDILPILGVGGRSRGGGSAAGDDANAPVAFTAYATDGCGAAFATIVAVECTHPGGAGSGSGGEPSCRVEIDDDTVTILESGPAGTVITWTVEAVDDCGNSEREECSITVIGVPGGSGSGSRR